MKDHDRTGVDGATVLESTDPGFLLGGVYQRYVLFHAQGGVRPTLATSRFCFLPEPKDTLESIVIDGEKWVSPAKQPVTEAGLRGLPRRDADLRLAVRRLAGHSTP